MSEACVTYGGEEGYVVGSAGDTWKTDHLENLNLGWEFDIKMCLEEIVWRCELDWSEFFHLLGC
jgi:hypothetical protein